MAFKNSESVLDYIVHLDICPVIMQFYIIWYNVLLLPWLKEKALATFKLQFTIYGREITLFFHCAICVIALFTWVRLAIKYCQIHNVTQTVQHYWNQSTSGLVKLYCGWLTAFLYKIICLCLTNGWNGMSVSYERNVKFVWTINHFEWLKKQHWYRRTSRFSF